MLFKALIVFGVIVAAFTQEEDQWPEGAAGKEPGWKLVARKESGPPVDGWMKDPDITLRNQPTDAKLTMRKLVSDKLEVHKKAEIKKQPLVSTMAKKVDCSKLDCKKIDCSKFDCKKVLDLNKRTDFKKVVDCSKVDCKKIDCTKFDCKKWDMKLNRHSRQAPEHKDDVPKSNEHQHDMSKFNKDQDENRHGRIEWEEESFKNKAPEEYHRMPREEKHKDDVHQDSKHQDMDMKKPDRVPREDIHTDRHPDTLKPNIYQDKNRKPRDVEHKDETIFNQDQDKDMKFDKDFDKLNKP